MPGSPPTNNTDPRTKPPPVTRSSSVIPDDRRGASLLFPVSDSSANVRPRRFERIETGTLPVVSSSASVFHSPQESHFPCQRLYAAPQFWQTKERVDLAICGLVQRWVRIRIFPIARNVARGRFDRHRSPKSVVLFENNDRC